MQNSVRLFGEYRKVIINPIAIKNQSNKKLYSFSDDKKTITIYPFGYAQADNLMIWVKYELFRDVLIDLIKQVKKQVPKSSINSFEFKKSQKMPVKTTFITKEQNITGLTTELCSKCNSNMMLKVNPKNGSKYLACSNYKQCKNFQPISQNWKDKSKNGYYLYFGPSIVEYPFDVIRAKIIFNLIITYHKQYSKDFMIELNKLCPEYWNLHRSSDINEIKEQIKAANPDLSQDDLAQIMGYLEVRNIGGGAND